MSLMDLKEFALFYVNEHKLSVQETKYLYDFIKEADEKQVMHLLLKGEPKKNLNESDIKYINEVGAATIAHQGIGFASGAGKAAKVGGRYVFGGGGVGSVDATAAHALAGAAAAVVAAMVAKAAYRAYKDKISKAGRKCSHIKHGTPERKKCEIQAKNMALQAQVSTLKSGMAKCAKSKNPDKCKASINSKIMTLQKKMR